MEEGLNGPNGPDVVLVFPPLDEGDEPGGVQMCAVVTRRRRLRVIHVAVPAADYASGLEPRVLQAEPSRGPSLQLALEQQADKVLGFCAHTLEVVLGETEVQPTDVQTRLLEAFVQEGRSAAEENVGHHACKTFGRQAYADSYLQRNLL